MTGNPNLSNLTAKKDVDTQELIRLAQEWKSLDENIKSQYFLNAYSDRAVHDDSAYVHTREAITAMLGDLEDTRKRTLSDYIEVVAALRETKQEARNEFFVETCWFTTSFFCPCSSWDAFVDRPYVP
jgi:hypothetical protein